MAIKIEDVPIEDTSMGEVMHALVGLKVGQSFVVPSENSHAIRQRASAFGKRTNKKFAAKTQPDGTVRIGRIAL